MRDEGLDAVMDFVYALRGHVREGLPPIHFKHLEEHLPIKPSGSYL